MALKRVDSLPLAIIRRLLLFDRWEASRTWPGNLQSGAGKVNPIEALIVAAMRNKLLGTALPIEIFELDNNNPIEDLIGAVEKDVLRDGADLSVEINSGKD